MIRYHCIRVVDADPPYQVGVTTNGLDFVPLERAAFRTPRAAIRYAAMRQAEVSPLREEPEFSPPRSSGSSQSGWPMYEGMD